MKTTYKVTLIVIAVLSASIISPSFVLASTSAGGGISAQLEITNIINQIIEFLTGPVALALIILGLIMGGAMVAISRQNDSAGWNRIGKVIIGGTVVFGALGVANLFFAGAVI